MAAIIDKVDVMGLGKKVRLNLNNPTMILKLMDRENEYHSSELITRLENSSEIFYIFVQDHIAIEIPQSEAQFVFDILCMYRSIESYKRDNLTDVLAGCAWGCFPGFDGNCESKYRAFAVFLIETKKIFIEQFQYKDRTGSFNPHAQTIDKYKRMINSWNQLGKDLTTLENIIRVLYV